MCAVIWSGHFTAHVHTGIHVMNNCFVLAFVAIVASSVCRPPVVNITVLALCMYMYVSQLFEVTCSIQSAPPIPVSWHWRLAIVEPHV